MLLNEFIDLSKKLTNEYFSTLDKTLIAPPEIRDGVSSYFLRGGKRFRPALVLMCAAAAGGEKAIEAAVPVACASELYHIFTLVHDDIIDDDDVRRGGPTVHIKVKNDIIGAYGSQLSENDALRYGIASAILSGDVLLALAVDCICDAAERGADIKAVQNVIRHLTKVCTPSLCEGEALDTRYGMLFTSMDKLFTVSEDDVIQVLKKKTGELFAFCTSAGYTIGSGKNRPDEKILSALRTYSEHCGIAFQLQDDILGVLSDEKTLGKPIGSDIREAKNTLILRESYKNASDNEKARLSYIVGNKNASSADMEEAISILKNNGGIEYSAKRADEYIVSAIDALKVIPDSEYKDLMKEAAHAMRVRIM